MRGFLLDGRASDLTSLVYRQSAPITETSNSAEYCEGGKNVAARDGMITSSLSGLCTSVRNSEAFQPLAKLCTDDNVGLGQFCVVLLGSYGVK